MNKHDEMVFIESESPKTALYPAYARRHNLLSEYRAALFHDCVPGQRLIGDYIAQAVS